MAPIKIAHYNLTFQVVVAVLYWFFFTSKNLTYGDVFLVFGSLQKICFNVLSSFGGHERVKEKIESYAHSEHNNDKFKSPEHIANCQKTGADLFHRKVKSKKVERSFFPESLLKLMAQNPEFYFGKSN